MASQKPENLEVTCEKPGEQGFIEDELATIEEIENPSSPIQPELNDKNTEGNFKDVCW